MVDKEDDVEIVSASVSVGVNFDDRELKLRNVPASALKAPLD